MFISCIVKHTYYPLLAFTPTVGRSQRCCTGFTVAGHNFSIGGATHGHCVYAINITVTVAIVHARAAIPRGPDENGTQATTALQSKLFTSTMSGNHIINWVCQ